MKKLYLINIPLMVMAEDDFGAETLAMEAMKVIDPPVMEILPARTCPYEWRDICPFGVDGNLTCAEILEKKFADEKMVAEVNYDSRRFSLSDCMGKPIYKSPRREAKGDC